jgi:NADH-quinone oxidoreductase subunit J
MDINNILFQLVFYFFAAMTVISAGVVVFSRNLIHSAFALLFTFFGVAALYVFLGADFLAATQMVIYVGGILVLLIFGVMLTQKISEMKLKSETFQFWPGLILAGTVFALLALVMLTTTWHSPAVQEPKPTTAAIGELFMKEYILPFEIASIFLLIALIGAAMIVRRRSQ